MTKAIKEKKDVYIQDQTTEPIDLYLFRNDGSFELESAVSIDDTQFTAVAGHAISIGDIVCFQEKTHFMQAIVLNVATNLITIDTPFDYPFTTNGCCSHGTNNLAVNGSLTPQIFSVSPKNLQSNVEWDITRMAIQMLDSSDMDDAMFGGMTALINGIVLRHVNGVTKNIFNIKTNGEFSLRNFSAEYSSKAPAGQYGFRSWRSFAGQENNGVTIRLSAKDEDELQLIVNDDLTDLDNFYAIIQGHVVD